MKRSADANEARQRNDDTNQSLETEWKLFDEKVEICAILHRYLCRWAMQNASGSDSI